MKKVTNFMSSSLETFFTESTFGLSNGKSNTFWACQVYLLIKPLFIASLNQYNVFLKDQNSQTFFNLIAKINVYKYGAVDECTFSWQFLFEIQKLQTNFRNNWY